MKVPLVTVLVVIPETHVGGDSIIVCFLILDNMPVIQQNILLTCPEWEKFEQSLGALKKDLCNGLESIFLHCKCCTFPGMSGG